MPCGTSVNGPERVHLTVDPAELRPRPCMPAAHHRRAIVPLSQRFTLRLWSRQISRQISIVASIMFVDRRPRASVGERPRCATAKVSARP